jgi:hypothetical protein
LASGVVDEPADRPVPLEDGGDRARDGVFVADVERMAADLAAGRLDLGGHRVEAIEATTGDGDGGAEACELVRDTTADAAAAARDEDRLPVEQAGVEDGAVALSQGPSPC